MKRYFFIPLITILPLFADEVSLPQDEIALAPNSSYNIESQKPQKDLEIPSLPSTQHFKSPSLAVMLSAIIPGLGHAYLGDYRTTGEFLAVGAGTYPLLRFFVSSDVASDMWLMVFQNEWLYGMYAGYRDARVMNRQIGYNYRMPVESFQDLSLAPFRFRIIKKPEVWGGTLGLLTLGIAVSVLTHEPRNEATQEVAQLSCNTTQIVSPLIAFPVGIGEEAFFRGLLLPLFTELTGPAGGAIISNLLFTMVHIGNAAILSPEDPAHYFKYALPIVGTVGAYATYLTLMAIATLGPSAKISGKSHSYSISFTF
jgi:membrane protease YdiL (CAAX protease family)